MRTSRKSKLLGLTLGSAGAASGAPSQNNVRSWVQELTNGDSPERSAGEWKQVLTAVVEKLITAGEWPGVQGSPKLLIDEIVLRAGAPGDEEKREALRTVLVEQVEKRDDLNERIFILRELALIGSEESVPALEELLKAPHPPLREYALRALESNPSKDAGRVLLKALKRARKAKERVALVNAMGSRGDKEAAEPLDRMLPGEKDEEVARAIRAAISHLKLRE